MLKSSLIDDQLDQHNISSVMNDKPWCDMTVDIAPPLLSVICMINNNTTKIVTSRLLSLTIALPLPMSSDHTSVRSTTHSAAINQQLSTLQMRRMCCASAELHHGYSTVTADEN